jgi:hypothetical protein
LELPFDDRAVEAVKPERFDDVLALPDVAWKPHADGWKAKDESVAALSGLDKEAGATNSASLENQFMDQEASTSEGEEFTLHRFLFGCLMGGAAAAAILLAFRIVLN